MTAGAVAGYVDASISAAITSAQSAITSAYTLASNAQTTATSALTAVANAVKTSDGITSTSAYLVTASAVANYVTGKIEALDASVSSSENNSIQVGVTQVDGKVTAVTADLVWLDASGSVIS